MKPVEYYLEQAYNEASLRIRPYSGEAFAEKVLDDYAENLKSLKEEYKREKRKISFRNWLHNNMNWDNSYEKISIKDDEKFQRLANERVIRGLQELLGLRNLSTELVSFIIEKNDQKPDKVDIKFIFNSNSSRVRKEIWPPEEAARQSKETGEKLDKDHEAAKAGLRGGRYLTGKKPTQSDRMKKLTDKEIERAAAYRKQEDRYGGHR